MLVIVGFFMYLGMQAQNGDNSVVAVTDELPPPVRFYLESLLDDAARSAVLEIIAPQSGYQVFFGPEPRHGAVTAYPGPHESAYYYLLGEFSVPGFEVIEESLYNETYTRFINSLDLSVFDDSGFTLKEPEHLPEINISINEEDITVLLHYPLEILTEDKHIIVSNMTILLPLRLRHAYDLSTCIAYNMARYDKSTVQALEECRLLSGIDDSFTVRIEAQDGKGESLIAVVDEVYEENTGVPFEYQFLFWKCSGHYAHLWDEKPKLSVCEYACVYEIPEPVLLGICMTETSCEHSSTPSGDGGVGIMQLTGVSCGTSFVDGTPMRNYDLANNIECGAQLLLGKCEGGGLLKPNQASYACLGDSGDRYCCPDGDEGIHICCIDLYHPCCENPEHPCCTPSPGPGVSDCGRVEDDPAFDPCTKGTRWDCYIPDGGTEEVCVEVPVVNYRNSCCDPMSGTPGTSSSHTTAGYCCSEDYAMPSLADGRTILCGEEASFKKEEWLTKNALYAGWDIAIRGYNGWGCQAKDKSATFQADSVRCRIQNYVDIVHYYMYELKDECYSDLSAPLGSAPTGSDGCCPDNAQECNIAHGRSWWP